MVNHTGRSQSIDVDLDRALGDRGGQGDDQHDKKHCDKEHASPSSVWIHGYYCDWEGTLLFNNQQAIAFGPRVYTGRRLPGPEEEVHQQILVEPDAQPLLCRLQKSA